MISSISIVSIDKKIKIPIAELEFHYGSVAFKHTIKEMNSVLDFEIENIEIRPEFEVLKPYFIKTLKSKTISVALLAEFENGKLVSQLALSPEIERIKIGRASCRER